MCACRCTFHFIFCRVSIAFQRTDRVSRSSQIPLSIPFVIISILAFSMASSSLKFTTKTTNFVLPKRTWTIENFYSYTVEPITYKPLESPVFYAPEHDLQYKYLYYPNGIETKQKQNNTAASVQVKSISGSNQGKSGYWKEDAVIVVNYSIAAKEEFAVKKKENRSKTYIGTFSFQINPSSSWSVDPSLENCSDGNLGLPCRSNNELVLECSIDVTYQTDSFCGVTCYPLPLTSIEVPRTGEHFEKMKALLETGKDSDLTLVVGDHKFNVHKFLLSAHSEVFSTMLSHTDTQEAIEKKVMIEDVPAEAMRTLLNYIYTGAVESNDELSLELFTAADKYQMDALKEACERRLSMKLTVESVLATFLHADLHSATTLKENCLKFITFHSAEVMSSTSTAWKQFTVSARPELITEVLTRLAAKMSL